MCSQSDSVFPFYGVTIQPETSEYMIAMPYANDGNLSTYLAQNINKLTWNMKLQLLHSIANNLFYIHLASLIHCDLHGGNIVLHNLQPYIFDLALSKSVNS